MQIGELAQLSGFSRDTLRYYEKLGLLSAEQFQYPSNEHNNYRLFKKTALVRLQQIQELKEIGFSLEEIHYLLNDLNPEDPCRDLPALFKEKIFVIDQKINQLQKFKTGLEASLNHCTTVCGSNQACGSNQTTTPEQMPQCINKSVQIYLPDSFSVTGS